MSTVGEIINRGRLVTIEPLTAITEAERKLDGEGISHLLVVQGGDLVGVLCVCDIDRAQRVGTVRDAMSTALCTVDLETDTRQAAEQMIEHGISCLPVLSGGALCGVVTLRDLTRVGVTPDAAARCSACGSDEHVRCTEHGLSAGFCLECRRRSEPPEWDDEVGGSS